MTERSDPGGPESRAEAPVAIVTGGGGGVGAEVAKQLVARGWRVVLAGRTESTLAAAARSTSEPGACLVIPVDLTDPREVAGLAERVRTELGRVDALVNNAGMADTTPIERVTPESLHASFAVNAYAPGLLIAAVFPMMKAQKSGRVVNVASKGIVDPFPGFFAYAAAKCALDSYTRSVENEGKRHGVHAFTVAPGAIETGMLRAMFSERVLPPSQCLAPADVARRVVECAVGERDDEAGTTHVMIRS